MGGIVRAGYADFFAEVVPKVARPFLEELLSLVLRKA